MNRSGTLMLAIQSMLGLAGCSALGGHHSVSSEEIQSEAEAAIGRIFTAIDSGQAKPSCGSAPAEHSADVSLVVSADFCYSCRGMGNLFRYLRRTSIENKTQFHILIPSADSSEICAFLRREKVAWGVGVFVLPDATLPAPALFRDVILAKKLPSGAQTIQVILGRDAVSIIDQLSEVDR